MYSYKFRIESHKRHKRATKIYLPHILKAVFTRSGCLHFLTEHAPYGAFHVLKAVRLFLRRDTVSGCRTVVSAVFRSHKNAAGQPDGTFCCAKRAFPRCRTVSVGLSERLFGAAIKPVWQGGRGFSGHRNGLFRAETEPRRAGGCA